MNNKFDNLVLDKEELEIEAAIKSGEYSSVENFEEQKAELEAAAKSTLEKNKMITVRLSQRNFVRLKAAAAREGIPYQTFVSSLIQKNT